MTRIDRSTLVFFDASCLITAAASPTGGAGLVWSYFAQRRIQAAVSSRVIEEAGRNLILKFPEHVQVRFESMIAGAILLRSDFLPRESIVPRSYESINSKDEHVVAAAISMGAQYLLTLDRPLIREVKAANIWIIPLTPEEFIIDHVPTHPEFPF